MKYYVAIVIYVLTLSNAMGQTEDLSDGEVRSIASGDLQAWDSQNSEWVALEAFWVRYADRRGGLTLGLQHHRRLSARF